MNELGQMMEGRPQGLTPLCSGELCGTAEAVPLSQTVETDAEVAA